MLKRPTRPLPRRFNRPVTENTRSFVERRHTRIREHRRERTRRWLRRVRSDFLNRLMAMRKWLKFVLAGLVILVLSLFLFSPLLHLREIRVVRTEGRVDLPKVLDVLSPLYGKHLLFLPTREVTSRVREVVPDALQVSVAKQYPSQVTVRITLSPLVARVLLQPTEGSTGSGTALRSGSGAAPGTPREEFLTENGMLVSAVRAPSAEPLPTIRIVDWGVRPLPGSALLESEFFERMRRAERTLTLEFGQQINRRTVYLRAREFHLATPTVNFWFDVRSPLEAQFQRLRTFLTAVKLTDVKSFIDLRLAGRVVYK